MMVTAKRHKKAKKRVYYLSLEYLLGRLLSNNLINFQLNDLIKKIHLDNEIQLSDVFDEEKDPALGNGGLGRLAACILDSVATLGLPGYGYGINYQFGLFKQYFENGWQKERADSWLETASPWQIERADRANIVPIRGEITYEVKDGARYPKWINTKQIIGVPYDMPVVGYGGKTVNYLRLFAAKSSNTLDIELFNKGGYVNAVEDNIKVETISKVLYPSDDIEQGKELRITQQYFFVSCVLNDIIRRFLEEKLPFDELPNKVVLQLNDTHPTLAIVELMRLLMDVYGLDWDRSWQITRGCMAYTNHTLLPEALEKWPVSLFEKILPRHLLIIYEINDWLMREVMKKYPGDTAKLARMSLIEEGAEKKIRMANLAIVGSFSVNGVAQIHTELLKHRLVPDFYEMWPEKFNNKTNGITPRRWLLQADSALASFITKHIGDGWITDLQQLRKLTPLADNEKALTELDNIQQDAKIRLAQYIEKTMGIKLNTQALFDCQVKRIHEYKRQLLNAMHIMNEYFDIIESGKMPATPKVYIFSGKAAPSYKMAKLIIKLINNMAQIINHDKRVQDMIKVIFIPNYNVSVAEIVMPAADVSEQISTAGFEASGTGNMKMTLNGALTIGTLDGANVEIMREVGEENFYLFGLTAEQVADAHLNKTHRPWAVEKDSKDIFSPIFQDIMFKDYYMLLADFDSYCKTHERIENDFLNRKTWVRKSLLNTAGSGIFSIDRTVSEYARDIWHVKASK